MRKILSPQEAFDLIRKNRLPDVLRGYITENFTWGEFFWECTVAEVMACPRLYFDNALKQAKTMELVRAVFNKPVTVTSWYRDQAHNKRAGGVAGSIHMQGLATDFTVKGYEGVAGNRAVQEKLKIQPFMKVCGLEITKGNWTHVDSRGYRAVFNA